MANQKIYNLRSVAMSFVADPSKGMIGFVFKIQKWGLERGSIFKKTFVKTSEVDQELEYEV
jgi:hypothetical protein